MKWILALSVLLMGGVASAAPLPRATPESQGVSSSGILDFVETADQKIDTMNSVIIVRHGQVIAEGWWTPYDANTRHAMYSLSKSFTSTAVGLAIEEDKFSLEDPILKFFPDLAPAEPSEHLKQMRVRDLLIMSSGHDEQALKDLGSLEQPDAAKRFLAMPVAFKPGTHFLYNTPASYMLSAIVQKTTGEKVLDYLRPRLFEPLGIENPRWDESADGVSLGGYGLAVLTEDIARFGLLYLHKGEWQGKQLVPAKWVAVATSRQTSSGGVPTSDWDQGYGYQFWRSRHGFRGDGAFGQFCFVLPEQDAVVAITSGGKDMQAVMNIVWDHLLPAMQGSVLPENAADLKKLQTRMSKLEVRPVEGKTAPRLPASISGKVYTMDANDLGFESLKLDWRTHSAKPTLTLKRKGVEQTVTCAKDTWVRGNAPMGETPSQPYAAKCAWSANDTFNLKMVMPESPFYYAEKIQFTPTEARLEFDANVAKSPPLHMVGHAK